jgi:hypothetical protein
MNTSEIKDRPLFVTRQVSLIMLILGLPILGLWWGCPTGPPQQLLSLSELKVLQDFLGVPFPAKTKRVHTYLLTYPEGGARLYVRVEFDSSELKAVLERSWISKAKRVPSDEAGGFDVGGDPRWFDAYPHQQDDEIYSGGKSSGLVRRSGELVVLYLVYPDATDMSPELRSSLRKYVHAPLLGPGATQWVREWH